MVALYAERPARGRLGAWRIGAVEGWTLPGSQHRRLLSRLAAQARGGGLACLRGGAGRLQADERRGRGRGGAFHTPPYTAWHRSYVVLGASLAPAVDIVRLSATLVAFFLAVGISAHALDELKGRPLGTELPGAVLTGAAAVALIGA